ncbi:hypothetical protein [Shewanella sp. MBTL60-007]|uniref:hypothetical protein n=1 Tax=Shewanella sp. MBTL60-007 TaxID=2815911 RepID=UPI001BBAA345|nr:hypothetical protein [Shewanella sp. MBTL60-007]GIU20969.1 hypothetical protein TUM3792_21270 [Shewanella sp. MBTL60-007]
MLSKLLISINGSLSTVAVFTIFLGAQALITDNDSISLIPATLIVVGFSVLLIHWIIVVYNSVQSRISTRRFFFNVFLTTSLDLGTATIGLASAVSGDVSVYMILIGVNLIEIHFGLHVLKIVYLEGQSKG